MNREEVYKPAFDIILIASEAKGMAINAIKEARENRIEAANKLLKEAKSKFIEVHEIQTKLIVNEARGDINELNIIMVHAQDHLTMANMAIEFASEFIEMYKIIGGENDN